MVDLFIIVFLIVCIGWDLPDGHLMKHLTRPVAPLVRYLGLSHSWKLFAPNPPSSSRKIVGLVHLADGQVLRWGGRFLTRLSWWKCWLLMRHGKWERNVMQRADEGTLRGYCEFLVHRYRNAGLEPVRIELGEEKTQILGPGETPQHPPEPVRTLLCFYEVTSARLLMPSERDDEEIAQKIAA